MNWINTLQVLGPLLLAAWPTTRALAPIIVQAVAAAEEMINASGAEKKTAALKLVDAGVIAMNTAAGREVVDPVFAHTVATIAIDALVSTVNLWTRTSITSPPLPSRTGTAAAPPLFP